MPAERKGRKVSDPEMSWEATPQKPVLAMDIPSLGSFPVGKWGHHSRTALEMTVSDSSRKDLTHNSTQDDLVDALSCGGP